MKPYYQDNLMQIINGDCRDMGLLDNSVQCVVTSPPYWGLRKYSGLQDLIWGDENCEHKWGEDIKVQGHKAGETNPGLNANFKDRKGFTTENRGGFCSLCGAWKGQYGLEPTPGLYIQHTVEILREIRRVLRKDGVVFWNIGDSYGGAQAGNLNTGFNERWGYSSGKRKQEVENLHRKRPSNLKPKDLCLIPFRVAIAAQEDGWWVRAIIIWAKPNPMPESVTDRPTESHEYILMLTKSARYYWDADAVREPDHPDGRKQTIRRQTDRYNGEYLSSFQDQEHERWTGGRNIRTVWEFPTQPYPEAHFAVFPEKLPEICIKAATPEVGCCSKCGAPWERVKEEDIGGTKGHSWHPHKDDLGEGNVKHQTGKEYATYQRGETLGWHPTCKCNADKVPSIVLDPFMGSGTTLWVAKKLGRRAVGYELSEEYCQLALERNRQMIMELKI